MNKDVTEPKTQLKFKELLNVVYDEIDISSADRSKLMEAIRNLTAEHYSARAEAFSKGLENGKNIWG